MGKNRKNHASRLPNRELYERMNFLYQSAQLAAATTTQPEAMGNGRSSSARNANLTVAQSSSSGSLQPLARFLTKEMRLVARKSVLRLSPHVKHSHCRACSTVLQAGVSCTVRVKGKKNGRRVITTCLFCGAQTRTMANPNHQLFVDKPEHTTISQNEE